MEFRPRDYEAEESAAALPRAPAYHHPLIALRPSPQVESSSVEEVEYDDPLRVNTKHAAVNFPDEQHTYSATTSGFSSNCSHAARQEWNVFKSYLMQKFSCSNAISFSSASDPVQINSKECGKSLADMHIEELDDTEKFKEEKKVITREEYVSRLQELKHEICQAWRADGRVKALKICIKVARLLIDTSVLQFYPALFTLVIEIMDMLGDLVWERIKRKAERADDGTLIRFLPENFSSGEVCCEAKETCFNWFCKIGSIRELLPRIYMELAILRCWRFLEDNHLSNIHRLTMMMRGLADPLASAYCHLYMVRCAGALLPGDLGYLVISVNDINILLRQVVFGKDTGRTNLYKNKKVLISLMEPCIEWIIKCLLIDGYQKHEHILVEFGLGRNLSQSTKKFPMISVVLHCLLKQLPAGVVSSKALSIIELIEENSDISLDQRLNYRLLGLKLCESHPPVSLLDPLMSKVIQELVVIDQLLAIFTLQVEEILSKYPSVSPSRDFEVEEINFDFTEVVARYNLHEYLIVADAYIELILSFSMDNYLSLFLEGILKRVEGNMVNESESEILQSVVTKLINHFSDLEEVFALKHLMEILGLLSGNSRDMINMQILMKATRTDCIRDPAITQLLFETCQALHNISYTSWNNDGYQQKAALISCFVQMVDFGAQKERHLAFLVECRAAFGCIEELKETVVHSSNNLAVKTIKETTKSITFLKSCMAFNEVTIPSILTSIKRVKLYIDSAEVALLGGLVSHAGEFIHSTISCLQCLDRGSDKSPDVDQIVMLTCKLCNILVMMPGMSLELRSLIAIIDCPSLISLRAQMKILCAIISLSATLAQSKLPYHAKNQEVVGNDILFFGEPSYYDELSSVSGEALQKLIDAVHQEPQLVLRGRLALEACNCLISSYKASDELSSLCSSLLDIAKACLHPTDTYLQATIKVFKSSFSNLQVYDAN